MLRHVEAANLPERHPVRLFVRAAEHGQDAHTRQLLTALLGKILERPDPVLLTERILGGIELERSAVRDDVIKVVVQGAIHANFVRQTQGALVALPYEIYGPARDQFDAQGIPWTPQV